MKIEAGPLRQCGSSEVMLAALTLEGRPAGWLMRGCRPGRTTQWGFIGPLDPLVLHPHFANSTGQRKPEALRVINEVLDGFGDWALGILKSRCEYWVEDGRPL